MKKTFILPVLALSLLTSACGNNYMLRPSMHDDTVVTQRDITIHEDRYTQKLDVNDITYDYLMGVSHDYERHGGSPLYVVVGYDPDNKQQALSAKTQTSVIKGQLAKLDIRDAVVTALPVQGSSSEAIVAYDRVTAKGPDNCGKMPGYDAQTGNYGDYGLGCTLKDLMAQQVAYPRDLQGQSASTSGTDAGRAAVIINRDIRAGEVSPFVPSYVLSGLAGNTTE